MIFTSRKDILFNIKNSLINAGSFNASQIYICATPRWIDAPPGNVFFEIIPGAVTKEMGNKEGFGFCEFEFQVLTFCEVFTNRDQDNVNTITDSTIGLINYQDIVDSILINNGLNVLSSPIIATNTESFVDSPEDSQWVHGSRKYSCMYMYATPGLTQI